MAIYCGTCCYMNREKQRKRKRMGNLEADLIIICVIYVTQRMNIAETSSLIDPSTTH